MARRMLFNLLGPLGAVLLWHFTAVSGFVNPLLLPTPGTVLAVYLDPDKLSGLLHDSLLTFLRAMTGFVIAALSGTALGIVLGWSRSVYMMFEFLIEFFRSLPAAALLPAFMLFLGVGNLSKVLLVAFSCSLVVMVYTAAGVRNRNATRTMVAQILRASKLQIFQKVILPEVLPAMATGLRISLSFALIITVVAEMLISTDRGLGRTILDMQLLFKTPEMYAAVLLTGVLGYLVNKGISIGSERLIHWEGK